MKTCYKPPLLSVLFLALTLFITGPAFSSALAATDCDLAQTLKTQAAVTRNKTEKMRLLEKAIRLCPGYIRPYELLGNEYREAKEDEKALQLLSKAADLGSNNHKLYYLLASLLYKKGDLDMAFRYLSRSLSIRDDYSKALALKEKIQGSTDIDGPMIRLFEPATPHGTKVSSEDETLTVRGVVTDMSGVAWFKINNQAVSMEKDGRFLKDMPLRIGLNSMAIEAADRVGNRSKLSLSVERKPPAAEKKTPATGVAERAKRFYRKSFAVVVGINRYKMWPILEFGVADAEAVQARLKQEGFDEITIILDLQATQRRILTALYDELPKNVMRDDRVVFYFAGHGQTHDLPGGGKKGFIIPVDAGIDDYTSTAVSMDQIRGLSSRIPAKHILYVMDSCYSGLGFSRAAGLSPRLDGYLRKVASMRVVQIMTAGGKGEQVMEKGGHGLFTGLFLSALDGPADLDHDGVITGTELGAYLRPAVSNASNQSQTPLAGRLEGEGEFLFFLKGR